MGRWSRSWGSIGCAGQSLIGAETSGSGPPIGAIPTMELTVDDVRSGRRRTCARWRPLRRSWPSSRARTDHPVRRPAGLARIRPRAPVGVRRESELEAGPGRGAAGRQPREGALPCWQPSAAVRGARLYRHALARRGHGREPPPSRTAILAIQMLAPFKTEASRRDIELPPAIVRLLRERWLATPYKGPDDLVRCTPSGRVLDYRRWAKRPGGAPSIRGRQQRTVVAALAAPRVCPDADRQRITVGVHQPPVGP